MKSLRRVGAFPWKRKVLRDIGLQGPPWLVKRWMYVRNHTGESSINDVTLFDHHSSIVTFLVIMLLQCRHKIIDPSPLLILVWYWEQNLLKIVDWNQTAILYFLSDDDSVFFTSTKEVFNTIYRMCPNSHMNLLYTPPFNWLWYVI